MFEALGKGVDEIRVASKKGQTKEAEGGRKNHQAHSEGISFPYRKEFEFLNRIVGHIGNHQTGYDREWKVLRKSLKLP